VVRVAVALVILALFTYSSWRASAHWMTYGDRRSGQNLLNNLALLAGGVALLLASYALDYAPDYVEWTVEVLTWAGLAILLVVGVIDVVSWRDA
jgi:hypothetical protein